jgi:hypothetical protein
LILSPHLCPSLWPKQGTLHLLYHLKKFLPDIAEIVNLASANAILWVIKDHLVLASSFKNMFKTNTHISFATALANIALNSHIEKTCIHSYRCYIMDYSVTCYDTGHLSIPFAKMVDKAERTIKISDLTTTTPVPSCRSKAISTKPATPCPLPTHSYRSIRWHPITTHWSHWLTAGNNESTLC